jgi:hypothetical protein
LPLSTRVRSDFGSSAELSDDPVAFVDGEIDDAARRSAVTLTRRLG